MLWNESLPAMEELRKNFDEAFPDASGTGELRFTPLHVNASHWLVAIQCKGREGERLLLKGRKRHARIWQSLEAEHKLLTEVSPKIMAANPLTRTPEVFGYYPAVPALVLQMIDGHSLHQALFGVHFKPSADAIRSLLELCGQWLISFHSLTRRASYGNPFEAFHGLLELPDNRAVLQQFGQPETYDQILSISETLCQRYRTFRQQQCTIHGEFTPYHVLLDGKAIYVIDLASSRVGYPYQDLGCFIASCDALSPWRAATGTSRISLQAREAAFLAGYCHGGAPLSIPEQTLIHLGRMERMIGFCHSMRSDNALPNRLRRSLAVHWLPRRFAALCRTNLLNVDHPTASD
jgi:hypothetical protein